MEEDYLGLTNTCWWCGKKGKNIRWLEEIRDNRVECNMVVVKDKKEKPTDKLIHVCEECK